MTPTREQLYAIAKLGQAVEETVNESPNGAPLGPMYLAFMDHGLSLDLFQAVVDALVKFKRIRLIGVVAYPINSGPTASVQDTADFGL